MQITVKQAGELLLAHDNIVLLAHQKPDGDTLGSSFALLYGLEQLGKTVRVECCDGFPERYAFLYGDYSPKAFAPEYVVTADVADLQLLGNLQELYGHRVDLCIDHHISNRLPAANTLLDTSAAATAQIVCGLLKEMGVVADKAIANAIFTGLSTDTGCFKYENVTPETHRYAADMIEAGAEHGRINKLMFDTMSKGRLEVDKLVTDTLEYYCNGECAVITIAEDLPRKYGVTDEEMDGISAKPRRIQGVKAGVTIREKGNGVFRISLRSGDGVDASRICCEFGGGGHKNAAGCTLTGTLEMVKAKVVEEVEKELERVGQA